MIHPIKVSSKGKAFIQKYLRRWTARELRAAMERGFREPSNNHIISWKNAEQIIVAKILDDSNS